MSILLVGCVILLATCVATDKSRENTTYDPLKGTYLDSFHDPSGVLNCSVYFVYRTMFLVDGEGCNSSDPFVKSLNFTFSNEPVPRVVYTTFGVLLEVPKINWRDFDDKLILNITSQDNDEFFKTLIISDMHRKYRYFDIPTLRGLGQIYGRYVESTINNIVMNTKIIMIFYLDFENYYDCDAYFWVGKGDKPDKNGTQIPDENGSLEPLKDYYKKTITLTLPRIDLDDPDSREMTIYDIDYIGIYCPDSDINYGRSYSDIRSMNEYHHHPIAIHPPFIFDRFFLGEDIILCLPNGTYSRELNLDDSNTDLPCLGGSALFLETNILLTIPSAVLLLRSHFLIFRTFL